METLRVRLIEDSGTIARVLGISEERSEEIFKVLVARMEAGGVTHPASLVEDVEFKHANEVFAAGMFAGYLFESFKRHAAHVRVFQVGDIPEDVRRALLDALGGGEGKDDPEDGA